MFKLRRTSWTGGWLTLAVAALLAAGGGWAFAATTTPIGVIHACAAKHGGALRLAPKCNVNERAILWNVQGIPGKNGTNGTNGANGTNGTNGTNGAPATSLWAVVDSTGTLLRGNHVVSAGAVASGYEVVFDRDVSQCSYEATLGAAQAEVGEVGVGPRTGNVDAVFVFTADSAGTAAVHGFNVAVFC